MNMPQKRLGESNEPRASVRAVAEAASGRAGHTLVVTVLALLAVSFAALAVAQPEPQRVVEPQVPVRFAAVDVYVDSGDEPLAAYQFELAAETGRIKIVGIEGGEHPAFADPPYYDPKAMSQDRVIIAAFHTGDHLPSGRIRVARIHVQIDGNQEPDYVVRLFVAASADGEPIEATATVEPVEQGEES